MVAVFSRTSWHVTARLCLLRRLCARMLVILIPPGAKSAHFKPFSLRQLQILIGTTLWERHRQLFRHSQYGNENDVPPAHWSRQTAHMPIRQASARSFARPISRWVAPCFIATPGRAASCRMVLARAHIQNSINTHHCFK